MLNAVAVGDVLDKLYNSASATQDVKALARAYAAQLRDLASRGKDFRTATNPWLAHDQCFFEELRNACPAMQQAHIGYVANQSGGFEACHWGWVRAGDGVDCYLQWEGRKLCFKIRVQNSSVAKTMRTKASSFLRGQGLGATQIQKPTRLGSGETMTVGVVVGLPIMDEARWLEVVRAMTEATAIAEQLALHLKSNG